MKTRKRFGQHFLHDPSILQRIVDALAPEPGDTVLEVGPGPGGLTELLLKRAGRVIAMEKDRDLAQALGERFPQLNLIVDDALDVDWRVAAGRSDYLAAGNIPYNITTPLIEKALSPGGPRRTVFLVQLEVARRLVSPPGRADYGALSANVQAVARVELVFRVPPGAFQPPPKVDSALVRLTPLAQPLVPPDRVLQYRRSVTGLFSYRRKQLSRAVRELTGWDREEAVAAILRAGLDPVVRPEVLSPAELASLSREIVDGEGAGD